MTGNRLAALYWNIDRGRKMAENCLCGKEYNHKRKNHCMSACRGGLGAVTDKI